MKVYFLYLKKTNRLYGYTADRNIKDRFLLERNPKCFYCKKEKMTDGEFVRFKNDESILELSLHPFYLSRKKCTELVATYHEIEKLTKKVEELSEVLSDTIRIRYAEAKSEAIKEFAERLKGISTQGFWETDAYVGVEQIDNLVKEMVGDIE